MATWFYAMMRILRLKDALLATIHQAQFRDLAKNDRIRGAILDISDHNYFRALYVLLRAVFPAIRALRYCDKGEPSMDKIYYLTFRATEALKRSVDLLNDSTLFTNIDSLSLQEEMAQIYENTNEYSGDE
jgi:hypothetical protein